MLKIGLVQLSIKEGDVKKNRRHIEECVEKYAGTDVDLLCFPELCISGYDFIKAEKSLSEREFFSDICRKYKVPILAGVSVREEEKYYDSVCIWDEEGKKLGEYRKIHLWGQEREFFEAGEQLQVVSFKGWKIGLLICADLRFFEVSTPVKNMGADVIICPSAWAYGWEELFRLCGRMRAAENQIYMILLNRASGDCKYCGGTAIVEPDGSIFQEISNDAEGYLEGELYKSKMKAIRERLPWEEMKRPQVYKKYDNYRFLKEND